MNTQGPDTFPIASGELDVEYLRAALGRAGRPPPVHDMQVEALLGGRTGATVQRITTGDRSFVLKFTSEHTWRVAGMGLK